MQPRLILRPGEKGTKKLVAEYGDRLLCVQYRYDAERKVRMKTAELVVEELAWDPAHEAPSRPAEGDLPETPPGLAKTAPSDGKRASGDACHAGPPTHRPADAKVRVKVAWEEQSLRDAVKKAGGRWKPEAKAEGTRLDVDP